MIKYWTWPVFTDGWSQVIQLDGVSWNRELDTELHIPSCATCQGGALHVKVFLMAGIFTHPVVGLVRPEPWSPQYLAIWAVHPVMKQGRVLAWLCMLADLDAYLWQVLRRNNYYQ